MSPGKVTEIGRLALGFAIAPLAGPILLGGAFLLEGARMDLGFVILLAATTTISFGGALVLGLPAYLFLRTRRWTAFWIAPLVGFMVAMVTWCTFLLLASGKLPELSEMLDMAWRLIGPIGGVAGALLWLIARPDRSVR